MTLSLVRALLPNRTLPLPILSGPFRGATINLNPQYSLRKVFGIYEHELNEWLEKALLRVDTVLDVGANDGYFTFGCAAAFRRLKRSAEIMAFEPISQHFEELKSSLDNQPKDKVQVSLYNCLVGAEVKAGMTTLDAIAHEQPFPKAPEKALIKIDVEGAELEVIAGASAWLNPTNYFLIEVHDASFLDILIQKFSAQGIKLKQVNQQALPIIGRERRTELNWWLLSDLA